MKKILALSFVVFLIYREGTLVRIWMNNQPMSWIGTIALLVIIISIWGRK